MSCPAGGPDLISIPSVDGAPHLDFEMWVFSETDSLRVVVHKDSISTVPVSCLE